MSTILTRTEAWRAVDEADEPVHSAALLAADPQRPRRYSVALDDLRVDYSRQPLTDTVRQRLLDLAQARGLAEQIEALFSGAAVNRSEGRPALHTALRGSYPDSREVDGLDVPAAVEAELERMDALVARLHSGAWRGYSGQPLRHVVNIGIGGSECGVTMAHEALARGDEPLQLHTVSGVDGRELAAVWRRIDPTRTLFCVASKSFTTQETLTNARTAWAWLEAEAGRPVPEQFVGVSANPEAMTEFGISPAQQLRIWDWVGGRYSLPSAMGFPLAAALGMTPFRELLAGMREMDTHFRTAPWTANIPVLLGLIGVWQITLRGLQGHVALPYHPGLRRFPAYLQQLDMESLGKSATQAGERIPHATGTSFWGEVGSNAQHSFFQWLHQGTGRVIAEFLVPVDEEDVPEAHRGLALANALGQAQALMHGQAPSGQGAQAEQRRYEGNRPVTLIFFRRLDARTLGRLVAMHEHRVFVQAALWGINPFDQWGVELGKQLAKGLLPEIRGEAPPGTQGDAATAQALAWIEGEDG